MYKRLFEHLWQDYTRRLCPSALRVHALLSEGEPLVNDHIALRTFNLPDVGLDALAAPFIAAGYVRGGEYHFEKKRLYAEHFEHPDPEAPKVFISELLVGQCSSRLQSDVRALVAQMETPLDPHGAFLSLGRPWQLSLSTYQALAEESEYAAWVAAHGYGANHFTVSINALSTFDEVETVNTYLKQHDFVLNDAGGEVKGGPEVLLAQSSTMADAVPVTFSDGEATVPGGFYEFAKRYPQADGRLYPGFVAASADKIFESTHRNG
ncbi:DUF1338 domain-containing protein [Thaumasiovibrio subtropicus]|uniref:DUF1338 domain-containing protein n=1 Tax=Thaumasiovibrio subtropicus TaxID=1891207 RepID=UPI000B35E7C3|nr:DUF1338 domain-containing protein [Thaumasiovibrio subtropicus]